MNTVPLYCGNIKIQILKKYVIFKNFKIVHPSPESSASDLELL